MLKEYNAVLEKYLKEVDWPFLGLFGELLNKDMRRVTMLAIASTQSVKGYCNHLKNYPALFSIYLCRVLMQTFGQHDHFQLWPEIQKALHLKEAPTDAEKYELWLAFRTACKKLGLEVSPRTEGTHFRVDEFLRQVGLSVHYADDLAKRMFAFARRQGIPDEDDPQSVLTWQAALCQTLNAQFSRVARDAVLLDRKGYYTQSFLRVYYAPEAVGDNGSLLEKAFAQALLAPDGHGQRVVRSAIPQVQLQNEMIGVWLPGGQPRDWKVVVDGKSRLLRSSANDQFIPLDETLPKTIAIFDDSGTKLVDCPLWEDEKNNRAILFSAETGFVQARGSLASSDMLVPPGQYLLLTRFEPQLDSEVWQLSDDPCLFLVPVTLGPGQKVEAVRGNVLLRICATAEPLLVWQGASYASREGHQIFRLKGLRAHVQVPADQVASGSRFEVDISAGEAGQRVSLPLTFDQEGIGNVEFDSLAASGNWQPGVWRFQVQLRRAGEARSLGKLSGYCWVGLQEILPGPKFVLQSIPQNLITTASDNVRLSATEISCGDAGKRSVQLVFALDQRREAAFSWMVPGVFVELLEYDTEQRAIRKPLAVGATLLASGLSSGQLIISSSEQATVSLGALQRHRDFARLGSMTLPLGALADYIVPDSNQLVYRSDATGNPITLVRLVRPQEIVSFEIKQDRNQSLIRFKTLEPVSDVQVRLTNLVSGDTQTVLAGLGDVEAQHTSREKAQVFQTTTDEGYQSTTTIIPARNLEPGLWIASFEVKQKSGWGRLSNVRGDYYAVGVVLGEDGEIVSNGALDEALRQAQNCTAAFIERVHAALQYCYAEQAWFGSLSWLSPLWRRLVTELGTHGDSEKLELLRWANTSPDDISSPSWIPQVTILSRVPALLAAPTSLYASLGPGRDLFHQSLRVLGMLPHTLANAFSGNIHYSLALAFGNAPAIATQQAHPAKFDVKKYRSSLAENEDRAAAYLISDPDYLPAPGEWLGPLHSRFVAQQLEERLARTQGGNAVRRGQAIGLARRAERYMRKLTLHGEVMDWIASPWEKETDDETLDSVRERLDVIRPFEHFFSVFAWSCRLEVRQPGALDKFLRGVAEDGVELEPALGFLLHVGEGMLGFYLLLWEFVQRAEVDAAPRFNRIPAHA